MNRCWCVVVVSLCATLSLPAQTVWQVPAGDPVQPIIQRAAPGDRIELLPSSRLLIHPDFSVDKPLQIVGTSPGTLVRAVRIQNIRPDTVVTLRNLLPTSVVIHNCRGAIVLESVRGRPGSAAGGTLGVSRSSRVLLSGCAFTGSLSQLSPSVAMSVENSTVRAVDCRFIGFSFRFLRRVHPAIVMRGSHLELASTEVYGGFGWPAFYDPFCMCVVPAAEGAPAIEGDGALFVSGPSTMAQGAPRSGPGALAVSGSILRTADVRVVNGDGPGVRVVPPQPSLAAPAVVDDAGAFEVTVKYVPGSLVLLFADFALGAPDLLFQFDLPFGLTSAATVAAFGVTGADGLATLPVVLPVDSALRHRAIFVQAGVGATAPLRRGITALRPVIIR